MTDGDDGTTAADAGAGMPDTGDPPEFEASLQRLEEIVGRLDREELELDEALALFEEGVGHLRDASRLLDDAEGVVEELIQDASGELEAVDFDLPTRDQEGTDG
jgi:exodeoxyribonuclease VII small subunit